MPKVISLSLVPALIVLAFASGNLHKYGLFLPLYDVIPQLKQFRSLGHSLGILLHFHSGRSHLFLHGLSLPEDEAKTKNGACLSRVTSGVCSMDG